MRKPLTDQETTIKINDYEIKTESIERMSEIDKAMDEKTSNHEDNLGITSHQTRSIHFLGSMPVNEKFNTTLHEINHTYLFQYGLENLLVKNGDDSLLETICQFFAQVEADLILKWQPSLKKLFPEVFKSPEQPPKHQKD